MNILKLTVKVTKYKWLQGIGVASPAMENWAMCPPPPLKFQLYNFSGLFIAAQTLIFQQPMFRSFRPTAAEQPCSWS